MIFSDSNTEIAAALAKSWAKLENPKHNKRVTVQTKKGGQYDFEYTDLGGIFDEAKKVFKENGISVLQNAFTEIFEGVPTLSVETMLLHSSGEWVKTLPLKMPSSDQMQDMGGQITYMKRYSLSALLGLATEADDDANGASGNSYKMTDKKASSKQLDFVEKLIKKKVTDKYDQSYLYNHLKKQMGIDKELEDWTSSDASKAITILQGESNAST